MTRFDFGTWLLLMHYAGVWQKIRGPACLVVFIPNSHLVVSLAKLVCPEVELIAFSNLFSRVIFSIFKREFIQYFTLNPIYANACCRWPHALYIFDMTFCRTKPENISCYVKEFDKALKGNWPFSSAFLEAYLRAREGYDYRKPIYEDMIQLFKERSSDISPLPVFNGSLFKKLRIESPYVVMNLNCKDYRNSLRNNRRINHPERYNGLIDFLISRGLHVVIQGRDEQPNLPPRKGLIPYFKSPDRSIENDYHLYLHALFAIFPKTGPEVFGPICNIPVLGLNYTELAAIVPKARCRFFPKHVRDVKQGALIHWKDLLRRPCFFDVGILSFEEGIEYIEMEEEELIQAAEEFIQLVPHPLPKWLEYSPMQKEFKNSLHPAHIDLFDVYEVPCDSYLNSPKYMIRK